MKNYIYIDKEGILHASQHKDLAVKFSKNGKVKEYSGDAVLGYPVVELDGKKVSVCVYGLDEAYINGNRESGTKVNLSDYPKIYDAYKSLM